MEKTGKNGDEWSGSIGIVHDFRQGKAQCVMNWTEVDCSAETRLEIE